MTSSVFSCTIPNAVAFIYNEKIDTECSHVKTYYFKSDDNCFDVMIEGEEQCFGEIMYLLGEFLEKKQKLISEKGCKKNPYTISERYVLNQTDNLTLSVKFVPMDDKERNTLILECKN